MLRADESMKVLVTGFEPFGGDRVNPSLVAAREMSRRVEGVLQVLSR